MGRSFLILAFLHVQSGYSQSFDFLPKSHSGETITHTYYSLSYVEEHEQSQWVAYELIAENAKGGTKRTNSFRKDPSVSTASASADDYKNSGYDRGHLAPAGDMAFSELAMRESFYMSNMSPQDPSFNRGIWKKLEEQVRTWAGENKSIYVVTGPVLTDTLKKTGPGKITVPGYFYKIILDNTEPEIKVIAFILPNKKGEKQLSEYVVAVDSIENLTKIDFFPALADSLENALEKSVSLAGWNFTDLKNDSTGSEIQKSPVTQCVGTTDSGDRCKRKTTNAGGRCSKHQ